MTVFILGYVLLGIGVLGLAYAVGFGRLADKAPAQDVPAASARRVTVVPGDDEWADMRARPGDDDQFAEWPPVRVPETCRQCRAAPV